MNYKKLRELIEIYNRQKEHYGKLEKCEFPETLKMEIKVLEHNMESIIVKMADEILEDMDCLSEKISRDLERVKKTKRITTEDAKAYFKESADKLLAGDAFKKELSFSHTRSKVKELERELRDSPLPKDLIEAEFLYGVFHMIEVIERFEEE